MIIIYRFFVIDRHIRIEPVIRGHCQFDPVHQVKLHTCVAFGGGLTLHTANALLGTDRTLELINFAIMTLKQFILDLGEADARSNKIHMQMSITDMAEIQTVNV